MSARDYQATATQLLGCQATSQQHGRQYKFAATIVNRFFSDNSLDRQSRVMECARRRQAKARDRALQQAVRVEQLELELAQAERIRIRKQERETSRMMRKLEHVAAAYLQYVWRRYCHLKREAIIRKARAERLLVDFLSYRSLSRKSLRRQASCRLQRHYRAYLMDKKQRLGLAVLASFILPIIRTRRARRHEHAIKRQAWSHWQICRKREHSVQKIQRAWRVSVAKANIRCCVQAFDRLKKFRRLARSARVIQRTLGTSIIQRRLLGRTDFAEYLRISVTPWPRLRPVEERVHHFWVHQVKLLQDGTTAQKRLVKEEKLLQSDIVDLQRRIGEAKTKLKSETERFRRHVMLEEHRRQKEEDARHVRLHELEEAMRQAIRLELEHEFETARRLMLRNKRTNQRMATTLRVSWFLIGQICNLDTRVMGKEELLDALVELQSAASVEDVRNHFETIQIALSDIQRKRWKFVEDACASVLRTVFNRLVYDFDDQSSCARNLKLSNCQGIDLCLEFLEPLIDSTICIVDTLDDEQEAAGQRGIVVAALLYLFTKSSRGKELNSRLVLNVLKCGVDMHVLISTLRFREELVECQRVLLPADESEAEELEMEEEEVLESKSDDMWWITEQVAKVWGFTHYRYFLATSGQDHTFAAWSCSGIANLIYAMIIEEKLEHALAAIVSPFSWLFLLASFAHCRIVSEDQEERLRGLEMLRVAVDFCPEGKLACQNCDLPTTAAQSFRGQVASFHKRNWITPLIQVITNAMVSFPDATHRSEALLILQKLVSKLVDTSRFWILRNLIVECPYGNVAAILVDFVRNDTVHAWSSSNANLQSPFQTTAICSLLYEALAQAAERDLVLHADLIASCLSLYRFLLIRDKDNTTGIRTETNDRDIAHVIARISKRLDVIVHEASLYGSTHSDMTHLIILEASLGSTLELCNKS